MLNVGITILYGNFTSPCSNVLRWKPSNIGLHRIVISLSFDGYTSLHRKCDCSRVRITKYFTIKDETYSSLTLDIFCFYIINYTAVQ